MMVSIAALQNARADALFAFLQGRGPADPIHYRRAQGRQSATTEEPTGREGRLSYRRWRLGRLAMA